MCCEPVSAIRRSDFMRHDEIDGASCWEYDKISAGFAGFLAKSSCSSRLMISSTSAETGGLSFVLFPLVQEV